MLRSAVRSIDPKRSAIDLAFIEALTSAWEVVLGSHERGGRAL
jgi:hypothetical protein